MFVLFAISTSINLSIVVIFYITNNIGIHINRASICIITSPISITTRIRICISMCNSTSLSIGISIGIGTSIGISMGITICIYWYQY